MRNLWQHFAKSKHWLTALLTDFPEGIEKQNAQRGPGRTHERQLCCFLFSPDTELLHVTEMVSDWILTPCQLHGVIPGRVHSGERERGGERGREGGRERERERGRQREMGEGCEGGGGERGRGRDGEIEGW